MSVGAFNFNVVGIRYSDLGVLELMWNPDPMRKWSSTVPALPRVILATGGGDMVTEGTFFPGLSWAEEDRSASHSIDKQRIFRFIGADNKFARLDRSRLKQKLLLRLRGRPFGQSSLDTGFDFAFTFQAKHSVDHFSVPAYIERGGQELHTAVRRFH